MEFQMQKLKEKARTVKFTLEVIFVGICMVLSAFLLMVALAHIANSKPQKAEIVYV